MTDNYRKSQTDIDVENFTTKMVPISCARTEILEVSKRISKRRSGWDIELHEIEALEKAVKEYKDANIEVYGV